MLGKAMLGNNIKLIKTECQASSRRDDQILEISLLFQNLVNPFGSNLYERNRRTNAHLHAENM